MARKVKCKICKKELTSDKAYKVIDEKGKNSYYCSKEEYYNMMEEKENKSKCLTMLSEIFDIEFCPPVVVKELNKIREYYDYNIIMETLKDQNVAETARWFLSNKQFDYGCVRYVFTLVENNIPKIYKKRQEELEKIRKMLEGNKNDIDIDIMNNMDNKTIEISNDNDISQWLDD